MNFIISFLALKYYLVDLLLKAMNATPSTVRAVMPAKAGISGMFTLAERSKETSLQLFLNII